MAMITLMISTASSTLPVITSVPMASGTVGTAFSYQIAATNSPTNFSAAGLPTGLSINTGTGLISG
ncbi:putative Ig domain-containing protein, partial [Klebsiella pneumoniae]|uniref:putative Ig domain-containing protein n=1 Tax=Klebsiella pneumoniae TaxID=573 RepID=UPI0030141AD5